jgi:hypothetical protein
MIDAIRWLAFQACPFRGLNESEDSKNQCNFFFYETGRGPPTDFFIKRVYKQKNKRKEIEK